MAGASILGSDEAVSVLSRAVSGDEIAFAQIVESYHTDLRRVSYVICGDLDMTDDAVQQAWHVAWRKLSTVRDPDRLKPWLVAVAANEARQLVRRRRRRREVELDPGWEAAFGVYEGPHDHLLDLARVLRQLSAEDRALLSMRFVAGMNASEISAAVGGSASGVRSRLARLLSRLREELTDA